MGYAVIRPVFRMYIVRIEKYLLQYINTEKAVREWMEC